MNKQMTIRSPKSREDLGFTNSCWNRPSWHKRLFLFLFFVFAAKTSAQTEPFLNFNWDYEVSCSELEEKPRDGFPVETIPDDLCIQVCDGATVNYFLTGTALDGATIEWKVVGGTIIDEDNQPNCQVVWNVFSATSSVTFIINSPLLFRPITRTICIEKQINPTANFDLLTGGVNNEESFGIGTLPGGAPTSIQPTHYLGCAQQTICFDNLSTDNQGSDITSVQWYVFNRSKRFEYRSAAQDLCMPFPPESSVYTIRLTVTNKCGCTSVIEKLIGIAGEGFEISCPGVVCEGAVQTYNLPFSIQEACNQNQPWTIVGGNRVVQDVNNGTITVVWDNVGEDGFGTLNFDPGSCEGLGCILPTGIRIPVIQTVGTIQGPTFLCQNAQGRYTLPRWPTTDFTWTIEGNDPSLNNLGVVIMTDQRNEIVIEPKIVSGTLRLRANYFNTLLGCSGTAFFDITVYPDQLIQGSPFGCVNQVIEFNTTNNQEILWTVTNVTNDIVASTATPTSSFSFTPTEVGGYVVSASGVTDNTCSALQFVFTVGSPLPAVPLSSIVRPTSICPNTPTIFSIQNPDPTLGYQWSITNGSFIGASTGSSVIATFTNSVDYTISVTPFSLAANAICGATSTVFTIPRVTIPAQILLKAPTTNPICSNSFGEYTVNALNPPNPLFTASEIYQWRLANPLLGSITQGQGTHSIRILWNNVTQPTTVTLFVRLQVCSYSEEKQFEVQLIPAPTLTINGPATICSGNNAQFTLTSNIPLISPGTTITWSNSSSVGNVSNSVFTNTGTGALSQTVTATVTFTGNCASTVSTSFTLSVLPGPDASISVANGTPTVFCPPQNITTQLVAAASLGSTLQWQLNGAAIPGATGVTFDPTAFGNYSLLATSSNGCSFRSNIVTVRNDCGNNNCSVPQNVSATVLNNCGVVALSGSNDTPVFPGSTPYWDISGPAQQSNYTGTSITLEPGAYSVSYNVIYADANGDPCIKKATQQLVVPYLPSMNYSSSCNNGNNNFTVTLTNTSVYYQLVTNPSVTFSYQSPPGSGPIVNMALNPNNNSSTATLAAGNYRFIITIGGTLDGVAQPLCSTHQDVTLSGIPNFSVINSTINCHDTAVRFQTNLPQLTNLNYLWTFEAGVQNTQAQPSRVFNGNGGINPTVNVVVTNTSGCTRSASLNVSIPLRCFGGSLNSAPTPAIACVGESISLVYTPFGDQCSANATYTWINSETNTSVNTNSPSLLVTQPGNYRVRVTSPSPNNCQYTPIERIQPVFRPLPTGTINVPQRICSGQETFVSLSTSATGIQWTLGADILAQFPDQREITLPSLVPGPYALTVTLTENGCSALVTKDFVVIPAPAQPIIEHQIDCNPYRITLIVANADPTLTYNWSNGMTGSQIIVNEGGVYKVWVHGLNCSSDASIELPRNPENYIWIFPTGCIRQCAKDNENGYIIGPIIPVNEWKWLEETNDIAPFYPGNLTPMDPLVLNATNTSWGALTQTYATGSCSITSPPLKYQTFNCNDCDDIKVEEGSLEISVTNKSPLGLCSFRVRFSVSNTSNPASNITVPISLSDPNFVVSPSFITIPPTAPGQPYNVVVLITPLAGATFPAVFNLIMTQTLGGESPLCEERLNLNFENAPDCGGEFNKTKDPLAQSSLRLYPNPTRDEVTIDYHSSSFGEQLGGETIAILDLTGRTVAQFELTASEGHILFDMQQMAGGVYVVVLRSQGTAILQQKVIKH
jgi:hypothetical protein